MSSKTGIGSSVRRREDSRFLTGNARFTDDIRIPEQAHAAVLRSPHPHATIQTIDTAAARAMPGVLLVLTARDLERDIKGPIPSFSNAHGFEIKTSDGRPVADAAQYPLVRGKVRYQGEAVAFVVAETLEQARDAATAIEVAYTALPAVMEIDQALAPNAPSIWDEHPDNVSVRWQGGDRDTTDAGFARAAHVTRLTLVNNRVAPAFMEPRAAIATIDDASGRLHLQAGSQSAHGLQGVLAGILGLSLDEIRVTVPDTGGGFGSRGSVYPEFVLVLVAARRLGRPVRWTAERSESFLTDNQARDMVMRGDLALDGDGRFLAMKAEIDWRHGGYLGSRNVWVICRFLPPTMGGVYRMPAAHTTIRGVFSNTTPHSAYRGIGRLETNYLMESLVDQAARELDRDPVALRRLNMLTPADMPWISPGGNIYSSGAFGANMSRALELADSTGFPARRAASARASQLRGFGVGNYIENDGGAPSEFAEIVALKSGGVRVHVGTQDFGMGHDTIFAQIVSQHLGIGFDDVEIVFGDTDRIKRGSGSHGSRSARIGGGATVLGVRKMIERGRDLAADILEAAVVDIEYRNERFIVSGTDRSASLAELAVYAAGRGATLSGEADFTTPLEAHSNGCHVAEVEIDPETGQVRLVSHVVVADVGQAINPMIVHGQIHGGAAQGIGQAMLERVVYDPDTGQTVSGSMMDYTLPRADDLPPILVELNEIIETDNPVGVKGAGEGATSGAPAAVMNAIRDAVASHGGGHIDMPAAQEQIWRALHNRPDSNDDNR